MSGYRRIQTGGSDRIVTSVLHAGDPTSPLTGLTTVVLSIWRMNGVTLEWYDFADATFKTVGWTTLQQVMTALDVVRSPGVYQYLWTTVSITNPSADDSYFYRVTDTSLQTRNVPQEGMLDVGQYPDKLDVLVSSRASAVALAAVQSDTDDIQARLPVALISGRMDSSVGAMTANVLTAAAVATDAIDADALAADAITEIQAGLATALALAAVQADTDDIQARLPATLNAGRMRSHVEEMDTDVIGATQIAAGAIGTSEAPLLANLDVAVSTRAAPGAAMDLITNAVDANALAYDAIIEIDAELSVVHGAGSWEGSTAAAVATAVWDEALPGAYGVGSAGKIVGDDLDVKVSTRATQSQILSDATPFPGVWVDAAVSSRAVPGDAMALTPTERLAVANKVWDEPLQGIHGADTAGERLAMAEKLLRNRLELADGSVNNWILYDDDSVTPLLSFNVTDKVGGAISIIPAVPARRTRGV